MRSITGRLRGLTVGLGLALSGLVTIAEAQSANVDFTVSGTSTIRGWTCTAKGVIAVTPGTAGSTPLPGFAKGLQSATVTVLVKGFTCPNPEMTGHLHQALKADTFPEIVYRVEKYEVAGSQVHSMGTMTITGVSKALNVSLALKQGASGVEVAGNTQLDMTDYGVDPPVVMAGLLTVGARIRIQFKGLVAP
jgi:polyisoprenoid-binding protein YceI